jgi:trimeric autotransporter adhesin
VADQHPAVRAAAPWDDGQQQDCENTQRQDAGADHGAPIGFEPDCDLQQAAQADEQEAPADVGMQQVTTQEFAAGPAKGADRVAANAAMAAPDSPAVSPAAAGGSRGTLLAKVLDEWAASPPTRETPTALRLGARTGSARPSALVAPSASGDACAEKPRKASASARKGLTAGKRDGRKSIDEENRSPQSGVPATPASVLGPNTPAVTQIAASAAAMAAQAAPGTAEAITPRDLIAAALPAAGSGPDTQVAVTPAAFGHAADAQAAQCNGSAAMPGGNAEVPAEQAGALAAHSADCALQTITGAHTNVEAPEDADAPASAGAAPEPSPFKPLVATKTRSRAPRKRARTASAPTADPANAFPVTNEAAVAAQHVPRDASALCAAVAGAHSAHFAAPRPLPLFKPSPAVSLFRGQQPQTTPLMPHLMMNATALLWRRA